MKTFFKYFLPTILLVVGLQAVPANAVQANINGALSNFDTFNDTGKDSHGFEIELDGVSSADVQYFFGAPYNRYGTPTVTDFSANGVSGVKVRWISQSDTAKRYANTTSMAAASPTVTNGHECYLGGPAGATQQLYDSSGCEHFGLGTMTNPTNVVYHWLVDDGTNTGQLVTADSPVAIPAPVWTITNAGNVAAALPAPAQVPVPALPAKPDCALWGPAKWMKVYKTESHAPAQLGALLTDNVNVPQEPAQVETEWKFIQARPTCAEDGTPLAMQPDNEVVSDAPVGAGAESVTRRYEFFDYSGTYDDTDGGNHEALPLCDEDPYKLSCSSAPMVDPNSDLGAYEGAQMVAANLALAGVQTPLLNVSMSGDGTGLVSDGNGIGCGDLCSGAFAVGASVTLTAVPDQGSHIAGWSIASWVRQQ
ncbi:MAG: PEP-CTERM sorting domain-containing protein [Actinobacteria bacterium]|nr:PEP-CTERM sorting domain-containing protein [Actinomycetota bacterium]